MKHGTKAKMPKGFVRRPVCLDSADIFAVRWTNDGNQIAIASDDGKIIIWNVEENHQKTIPVKGGPLAIAWSPDGSLAHGRESGVVYYQKGQALSLKLDREFSESISHMMWSPDGRLLAIGNGSGDLSIWDSFESGLHQLPLDYFRDVDQFIWHRDCRSLYISSIGGHIERWDCLTLAVMQRSDSALSASCFAWGPNNQLVVGDTSGAIHLVNPETLEVDLVLEGHSNWITSISFSNDQKLMITVSSDGTATLWRCDTWRKLHDLPVEPDNEVHYTFSPSGPVMALARSGLHSKVELWDFTLKDLLEARTSSSSVQYTSAKVLMIGDSSAGKTCLAAALRGENFRDTPTTHGMEIWTLPAEHFGKPPGTEGTKHEVVLWDLGGQEWYQLVHQLFLPETTVVVLVLDPTRQRITHDNILEWDRRVTAQCGKNVTKLLVGAKCDNPLYPVDFDAIDEIGRSLGYNPIILTSARNGIGIRELKQAIGKAIDWESLIPVGRPEEFTAARNYLLELRKQGQIVLDWKQLTESVGWHQGDEKAYNAMIRALQRQGLVVDVDMGSGRRVLILQQEVVSRLAGSVILAARDDQRECGSVNEERVRRGDLPNVEVIPNSASPSGRSPLPVEIVGDVMAAVIQLLLQRELAFRHAGLLWFPALFKLSPERFDDSQFSTLIHIEFEGAIDNLYSQLIVQLSRTGAFTRTGLWERQARFEHKETGSICGLSLKESRSGRGLLGLFFSQGCAEWVRGLFGQYVRQHLELNAQSVSVTRVTRCQECDQVFDQKLVAALIEEGLTSITCARGHQTQLGGSVLDVQLEAPVSELRLMRQDIKLAREVESTEPFSAATILYAGADRPEAERLRLWLAENCGLAADVFQIGRAIRPLLNGILPHGASFLYCVGATTDLPTPDILEVFKRLGRPLVAVPLPSAGRRVRDIDMPVWSDYRLDPAPPDLVRAWRNFRGEQMLLPHHEPIRILHLSDLHFVEQTSWRTMLQPLVIDLQQTLGFSRLDYVVISGDITHKGQVSGYGPALEFTRELITQFDVSLDRLIIVPGNHDVDRKADVYEKKFSYETTEKELQGKTYQKIGSNPAVYAVRKDDVYFDRFKSLSEQYLRPLLERGFWADPNEQADVHFSPKDGVAFLTLNSCWELDGLDEERASIHQDAVTDAIDRLTLHKRRAGWAANKNPLVISVFHHPVTGPNAMKQTDFLERLAQVGTRICLTGHVHENTDSNFYDKRPPRIDAIGAGSFGAVTADRPPNTPNQYNVLEIKRDLSSLRVYTRARPREGGTWEGLFKWGADPNRRQAFYDINLV